MIRDQHHWAVGQQADRRARVKVDQAAPAQHVVQQGERAAHDALQEPRAARGVSARGRQQLQQRERAVAEGCEGEVERQNREQGAQPEPPARPFHHAPVSADNTLRAGRSKARHCSAYHPETR